MNREIEEPGAPRTGEAPARRRRRAVVEATKKPKAPVKKPEAVVEPKVVKPRRPKPKADVEREIEGRTPPPPSPAPRGEDFFDEIDRDLMVETGDSRIERLIAEEEEVSRRIRDGRRPGNSDNAANSERMRQARADRRRVAAQKVDLNQILNEPFFGRYVREDVIPNDRIMIVNNPDNFPSSGERKRNKIVEARQKINKANAGIEKIEQAIARGELSDSDFIERNNEKINIARVKTYLKDYRDAWQEVLDGNTAEEDLRKRPATPAQPKPQNALPQGWNQGPGTIITHENGDIIDQQIATNKWFVVFGRPSQSRAGFDNREDAISWHQQNVLNRNASAVDPIDAPFIPPNKKDVRKAPANLKHKAPKIEVAKFDASQEEAIERVLIEIADVERLNKFSLAVDQANFYQNEGRQNALRNYQKRLAEIAKKLRNDPRARMPAQVDAEIAQAKQALLRSVGGGDIATARARLEQLNNQLVEKFSRLRQPAGNDAAGKEADQVLTMEQIGVIKQEMGNLEGVIEVIGSLDAEVRKTVERISQGYEFNPDATDIPKPTPQAVKTKIKEQIAGAIDRRQGKLAKYLKERHPQGGAPYEDMTPEKWAGFSSAQKNEYVKQAYSHKLIKGKNGRFYNATAEVRGNSVEVQFNEVNAEGQVIRARIGSSSRQLFYNGNQVYQQSMNVRSKLDRGADIQTIYNQHAFLYLSKIGITKAKVTAADDGQYVWARVGFKQSGGVDRARLQGLVSELRFYEEFGAGGLISNDAEYARIASILKQSEGGTRFYHQDIIFAVDDVDDRARAEYVKQWFKSNMPFGGGVLNFADQKVAGAGRTRRPRAPRVRV
jgi:hypothetical protein